MCKSKNTDIAMGASWSKYLFYEDDNCSAHEMVQTNSSLAGTNLGVDSDSEDEDEVEVEAVTDV